MSNEDNKTYHALAIPSEALDKGGAEILRAGLIDEELYVAALRAFDDPAIWGEVLADIAHKIALMFSAEDNKLTEQDALTQIAEAFAAELGAPIVQEQKAPAKKSAKAKKPAAKAKPAKKAAAKKPAAKKSAAKAAKRKKR
jgi:topoisomerase IA-like protein